LSLKTQGRRVVLKTPATMVWKLNGRKLRVKVGLGGCVIAA
jgi:hypothetical protein